MKTPVSVRTTCRKNGRVLPTVLFVGECWEGSCNVSPPKCITTNFDFVVAGIINLYSITASKTILYLILTVVGSNINLI